MTANVSTRKPHAGNAGYICERKARLGGHIVVYDRKAGADVDADERWIVMHEPSSNHVAIRTERDARELMKALAEARSIDEARQYADGIFPVDEADEELEAPRRPAAPTDQERAALARFLADPENEPSAEGKAALLEAFELPATRRRRS